MFLCQVARHFLSLMFPVRVQLAKYRIDALRQTMKIVLYSGVIAIAIDSSMVLQRLCQMDPLYNKKVCLPSII